MLQLLVDPDLNCVIDQQAHDQVCLRLRADLLFPDTLQFRYTSGCAMHLRAYVHGLTS